MTENIINEKLLQQIAAEHKIKQDQIQAVLQMINEGSTVPFIARYRKELTGGLDEEQIRVIHQAWEYGQKLANRKEDIMRLIEEKGKLTEELKKEIIQAEKLSELEDIYLPYKEKKKTRATEAKRKGLEPLAMYLLSFPLEGDVEVVAQEYVTNEITEELQKDQLVVKNTQEALQGAMDIVAEMVSEDAKFRKWIRGFFERNALIAAEVKDEKLDEKRVYEMYYAYEEPIKDIKLHRVLALNRGESEKVLRVFIKEDIEKILRFLTRRIITVDNAITEPWVLQAIEDGYKRLIRSSIEREIRADLKEKAEDQAIHVFSENLKKYLLTPPMKGKVVLGIDPAYRTGCKMAIVDVTGKVLDIDVIYPTQMYPDEKIPQKRLNEAKSKILKHVENHKVEVIAIGNGTASRETESFVADLIKESNLHVNYIIVNEAGASVYSASDLAREEFPNYEVEQRSAASIARRLQDPLSELVKIDPKSIGVGQYQYDVTQSKLGNSLNFVVETVVNNVGVNVNSASVSLLQYVSGLTAKTAKQLVNHRDEHGEFKNRSEISTIKGFGPKTIEQAIGFLRIPTGQERLDMTAIHPESYAVAEKILEKLGFTKDAIGTSELVEAIKKADKKALRQGIDVGEFTFNDILDAFVSPLRDPREDFDKPILRSDVLKLSDLQVNMELQGTVRNVVDFGVFVDCGVKEDGLVHISRIKKGFIKHPLDVVSVGQIVKVWVVSVQEEKGRLELTMIDPNKTK